MERLRKGNSRTGKAIVLLLTVVMLMGIMLTPMTAMATENEIQAAGDMIPDENYSIDAAEDQTEEPVEESVKYQAEEAAVFDVGDATQEQIYNATNAVITAMDTLVPAEDQTEEPVTQSVSVELWNSKDAALSSAWLRDTATLTTTTDGKTTITLFTQGAEQGSMTAYLKGLSVDGTFADAVTSGTLVEGENFPESFTVEITPDMTGTQSIPVRVRYTPYPVPNEFPFPDGHEVAAHLHIIWDAGEEEPDAPGEEKPPTVDEDELADGNYTISGQALKAAEDVKSMLHGYLVTPDAIPVLVANGKITLTLKFDMGNYSLTKLEQKVGDDFEERQPIETDTYALPVDALTDEATIRVTIGGTPMGPQTARLVLDPDTLVPAEDQTEEPVTQSVSVELWNSTDAALSSAWLRDTATLTTTADGKTAITLFTQGAGQGSMTAYLKGLSVDGTFADATASGTLVEGENFPESFTVEITPNMTSTQSIPLKVRYTPYPVPNGFPFPDGHEVAAHLHIIWDAGEKEPDAPGEEEPDAPGADKTALGAALTIAKAVTKGNKTDSAWQRLQTAIAEAQTVFDADDATQEQTDNAKKAVIASVDEFAASSDKPEEAIDKDNLPDGTYFLTADMVQINRTNLSMVNDAINHNVTLNVIGGLYYIAVDFAGVYIGNDLGYLSGLKYYDAGFAFGAYGVPQGTLVPATVLSWQTDGKGEYIVDAYNNKNNPYPKRLQFPLVNKADYEGNFVPVQVFVPIMEAMMQGNGAQDVLLRLDWTSLKVKTDENGENPGNNDNNANNNDNSNDNNNNNNNNTGEQTAPVKTELAAHLAFAKSIEQGNYTDISYQILQSTIKVAQGVYDSKYATQTEINEQISILTNAVNGLTLRPAEVVNKYGMTDGKYEVRVDLWHATQDKASMGNGSLNHSGLIEVVGDTLYMSVSVHPIQVGAVTASLSSLQIKQANGSYVYAEVTARNIAGNKPSAYRFVLPSKDTYIPVRVDPQVSVMGNETVDARLYISWDTLTKVSADTTVSGNVSLTALSSEVVVSQKQTLSNSTGGVKVEADANVLPDGTTLGAREITSGEDYNKAAKALDGIVKSFVLYDITLTGPNGDTVQPNGKVKVSIPLPPGMDAAAILIYRINADGSKTLMEGSAEGGFVVFTTTHFSLYAVGERVEETVITKTAVVADTLVDDTYVPLTADVPLTAGGKSGVSLLWLLIPIAGAAILAAVFIVRRKLRMQEMTEVFAQK
ncbi:hypothetical protein AGMMS49983_09900 [Clostridia bacterium]|nr:hypothetical protein AGMMS49983_09900 [Clostridia bacterium]